MEDFDVSFNVLYFLADSIMLLLPFLQLDLLRVEGLLQVVVLLVTGFLGALTDVLSRVLLLYLVLSLLDHNEQLSILGHLLVVLGLALSHFILCLRLVSSQDLLLSLKLLLFFLLLNLLGLCLPNLGLDVTNGVLLVLELLLKSLNLILKLLSLSFG